jgi:hypothetical protein
VVARPLRPDRAQGDQPLSAQKPKKDSLAEVEQAQQCPSLTLIPEASAAEREVAQASKWIAPDYLHPKKQQANEHA